MTKTLLALIAITLLVAACQTDSRQQVLATDKSQVALRSIQQRAFDTTDELSTLRTVFATLQNLGFVIDKADDAIGSASATKLDRYRLRITVSVRPRGQTRTLARANAEYNYSAVEEPEPYQQFFAALERSMFLTAHRVD